MKISSIGIFFLMIVFAQPALAQTKYPQAYPVNQMDLIFSLAEMNSTTVKSTPVLRFTGFYNYEWQAHIDFGKTVGMYFGFGTKNVGLINHFENRDINFKQRAYTVGLPLAFKIGSLERQTYAAVGVDFNFMMHYKQKFLFDDTKIKKSEWFSDNVNLFNPAVFLQFKFLRGQQLTFKYFLKDFLRYQSAGLLLPDGTLVADYGRSSKLFYVSWGISIADRGDEVKKKEEEQRMKAARWEQQSER